MFVSAPAASRLSLCTVRPYEAKSSGGVVAVVTLVGLLLVVGLIVVAARRGRRAPKAEPVTGRGGARELEVIREVDPDFSVVLLEDFIYALYTEAHTARGQGQLGRLEPYLQAAARQTLEGLGAAPVPTVVVGSLTFLRVRTNDPQLFHLEVEIEANYAEGADEQAQSYYVRERWTLMRQRSARSRPPARVRVLRCPCCDAPTDQISGRTCGYCGEVVTTGRHEWVVEKMTVLERETRGPMLTGTTEEQGSELPTVVDPELVPSLAALTGRDPQFSEEGLRARVELIFGTMQAAWSSLEWESARPFLSDRLHEAQRYWIHAYRAAGLRNVLENARVTRLELARVSRDRWFDAVTVRLFAAGLDYTRRESDGAVVGGNNRRERAYTEYWTLIRSVERGGPARATPDCPQCGAPLAINMAGQCDHCQAKVNSGEFDWVLSRIEQDESYQG